MKPKPIALDAHESLAGAYTARVDNKPHNAYYERPASLSLLPEVNGKRVLDAGCGPGVYAEWLVTHGADVLAVDVSAKMVQYAGQRLGDRAKVIRADLSRPLNFLEDASFDIVLSALALDYVKDWYRTFKEFHRVLWESGVLVFSVCHPFAGMTLHDTGRYFDTELFSYRWVGFGAPVNIPAYRRPLGAVINPLLKAGFSLEHILESVPTKRFKKDLPQDYEELTRRPGFMCVRAVKAGKPETGAAPVAR
jgi:SAM-dependent methyltransferase